MSNKEEELDHEDNEKYVLTEWGCLYCVLLDYGIDLSSVSGRVGKHIVEDFMEAMCKAGCIEKIGDKEKVNNDSNQCKENV